MYDYISEVECQHSLSKSLDCLPLGWPKQVKLPGTLGWVQDAVYFLLSYCPSEYCSYQILQKHPIVLCQFAEQYVSGQLNAIKSNLVTLRELLSKVAEISVIEAAAQVLLTEEARLKRVKRSIRLIDSALHGVIFSEKV